MRKFKFTITEIREVDENDYEIPDGKTFLDVLKEEVEEDPSYFLDGLQFPVITIEEVKEN